MPHRRSIVIFFGILSTVLIAWYSYLRWQLVLQSGLEGAGVKRASLALVFPFVLMLGFIFNRVVTRHHERAAWFEPMVHWLSFLSMGFLNFALVLAVARQLVCGLFPFLTILGGGVGTVCILAGAVLMMGWGMVRARSCIEIETVSIPLSVSTLWNPFRIVQVSDLHIDWAVSAKNIQDVVEKVNAQNPHIVVLTGDMADGKVEDLREKFQLLSGIKAEKGVFYITGNHEYYWGAEAWIEEVRRLGFIPLLNEHRVIDHEGHPLVLAGITDYQGNMVQALYGAPEAAPRILLAHQPLHAMGAVGLGFDLQLSGHTHGGQFFPWTFFIRWAQKFHKGLFKLESMWVYVNRGTGFWGPPIRLGSPPEITVVTLKAA